MKTVDYWRKRAVEAESSANKSNVDRTMQISNLYKKSFEEIEKDILKIVDTYAKNGNISQKKALELLTKKDTEELLDALRTIANTIENKAYRKQILQILEAPAYRARINRLQALQAKISTVLAKTADIQNSITEIQAKSVFQNSYFRLMYDLQTGTGYGFSVASIPENTLNAAINHTWSKKHFSSTVWDNTHVLAKNVREIVQKGIVTGMSYARLTKELQDIMNSGQYQAARVIRTEMNYFHGQGRLKGYEMAGIKKYRYIAILDLKTSKICQALDNKVFLVSEAKVGVNFHPMHPHCRSTDAPAMSDNKELQRRARNPKTGKSIIVPGNMSYQEWKRVFVDEELTLDEWSEEQVEKNADSVIITNEQFGKKIGEHAAEWGLNPANPEDREMMKRIIEDICANPDVPTRIGSWRGQTEEVLFCIKGEDVVIKKQNGEFVTIMKGGASNGRVKDAREF